VLLLLLLRLRCGGRGSTHRGARPELGALKQTATSSTSALSSVRWRVHSCSWVHKDAQYGGGTPTASWKLQLL